MYIPAVTLYIALNSRSFTFEKGRLISLMAIGCPVLQNKMVFSRT